MIDAPNSTNIVIQDMCPLDATGHIAQAVDPNVLSMIRDALDPAHATPVSCVPFFAGGL